MLATQINLSTDECIRHHLLSTYDFHIFIYSLFPKIGDKVRSFIYVDKGVVRGFHTFLVFSEKEPIKPNYGSFETKEIPSIIFSYSEYRFSVRMNPVRRTGNTIVPIIGRSEQGKWFLGKCLEWGFSVDQEQLLVSETTMQEIKSDKHKILQESVVFSGVLTVTDSGKFKTSVEKGIGRSKGFGFGLLEIVPIA